MSKTIPAPRCDKCDGLGQIDKYDRNQVCFTCNGTGTLNQAYNERVKAVKEATND